MKNEFSRLIKIDELLQLNSKFEEKASTNELLEIAKRLGVERIGSFVLTYTITNNAKIIDSYILNGSIKSNIIKYNCNNNEEPVNFNETFEVFLVTESQANENEETLENYDIEIIDEEKLIDVGEIATQYLSLALFM